VGQNLKFSVAALKTTLGVENELNVFRDTFFPVFGELS